MAETPDQSVFYTVTAEIDDSAVAERYLDWLIGRGEFGESHVRLILAWGGTLADIAVLDAEPVEGRADTPVRVECRYEFPDRGALERYIAEGSAPLRAEGKRLFLDAGGIRMTRRIGTVVARLTA